MDAAAPLSAPCAAGAGRTAPVRRPRQAGAKSTPADTADAAPPPAASRTVVTGQPSLRPTVLAARPIHMVGTAPAKEACPPGAARACGLWRVPTTATDAAPPSSRRDSSQWPHTTATRSTSLLTSVPRLEQGARGQRGRPWASRPSLTTTPAPGSATASARSLAATMRVTLRVLRMERLLGPVGVATTSPHRGGRRPPGRRPSPDLAT